MADTEQMRARFLEELGPAHAACYPQYLERRFPHVFEHIASLWGSAELMDYLQDLLLTDRPNRQGFPTEAAEEILRLYATYQELGLARRESRSLGTGWDWVDQLDYFAPQRRH
jgi:hypothetical protein